MICPSNPDYAFNRKRFFSINCSKLEFLEIKMNEIFGKEPRGLNRLELGQLKNGSNIGKTVKEEVFLKKSMDFQAVFLDCSLRLVYNKDGI